MLRITTPPGQPEFLQARNMLGRAVQEEASAVRPDAAATNATVRGGLGASWFPCLLRLRKHCAASRQAGHEGTALACVEGLAGLRYGGDAGLDELSKGTWIVNSTKHLGEFKANTPELSFFEATEVSGKAGIILARLAADAQEIIPAAKARVFQRESKVTRGELPEILRHLKRLGKIDYTTDENGQHGDIEVYCFSAQDALKTCATLYDQLERSPEEEASLLSLGQTFLFPREHSELMAHLTTVGVAEQSALNTLQCQESLGLVKVDAVDGARFYYNEYAFAGQSDKITRALKSIPHTMRNHIEEVQALVLEHPGYLREDLERKYPTASLEMMEGVGLLDAVTVESDHGNATFVTSPQAKGITIDVPILSGDVFHKAKVLLSSLRYGELKSTRWRGMIDSTWKMMNIVDKLLRGEWVGPCTAIGQDYQLLERDGVIETRPADGRCYQSMYYMKLRQREVGILVRQMLQYNRVFPDIPEKELLFCGRQPREYRTPEDRRCEVLARTTRGVADMRAQLMQAVRTGMGRG